MKVQCNRNSILIFHILKAIIGIEREAKWPVFEVLQVSTNTHPQTHTHTHRLDVHKYFPLEVKNADQTGPAIRGGA